MPLSARFVGRLYTISLTRFVDLPPAMGARFKGTHVPVQGSCNGAKFRGTLVPRGQGRYRLALNAEVRRAAGGVDVGDEVLITLSQTAPHRIPQVPPDLAGALATRPGGRVAFEAWPPGRRRQVLAWLAAAKRPDTRARRVVVILERLGFPGRPWRAVPGPRSTTW